MIYTVQMDVCIDDDEVYSDESIKEIVEEGMGVISACVDNIKCFYYKRKQCEKHSSPQVTKPHHIRIIDIQITCQNRIHQHYGKRP